MAEMPEINMNVNVRTNLRIKHRVLYLERNFLEDSLKSACRDAETKGMILTGVVPVGPSYGVAVFVGAEDFFRSDDDGGA